MISGAAKGDKVTRPAVAGPPRPTAYRWQNAQTISTAAIETVMQKAEKKGLLPGISKPAGVLFGTSTM